MDDFGQSGVASAYCFVVGVRIVGAGVAAFDIEYAFFLGKGGFETPEATAGQRGQFESFRCGFAIGWVRDMMWFSVEIFLSG